jgi:hypothetical protein
VLVLRPLGPSVQEPLLLRLVFLQLPYVLLDQFTKSTSCK